MEIILILIGTVIGAIIGWNYQPFKSKGSFTRLDITDDGKVYLEFDFKKRFGKIDGHAKSELTEVLKEDNKGLTQVLVTITRPNELMICMKYEKIGDEPFSMWLEEQRECLTYLCKKHSSRLYLERYA